MYQDLKNFKTPVNFRGKSKLFVQIWWIVESTLFAMSPQFLYGWRRFLLRVFGAHIGKGVFIRSTVKCTYPWKVSIGDYSWIGENCILYSLGNISIGNNVAVAHNVHFNTGFHDYTITSFDIGAKSILIEDECWLASDVYIAPGVTVGRGAIVGARSSVFNNLEAGNIYVGSPAKFLKKREPSNL